MSSNSSRVFTFTQFNFLERKSDSSSWFCAILNRFKLDILVFKRKKKNWYSKNGDFSVHTSDQLIAKNISTDSSMSRTFSYCWFSYFIQLPIEVIGAREDFKSSHNSPISNISILKKTKSWRYPAKTMTKTDYADDPPLLANTSTARSLSLYVKADKTDFMCFKQDGAISTINDKPMKLEDWFTYLGSIISSTETNVTIHIGKALTAFNERSIK